MSPLFDANEMFNAVSNHFKATSLDIDIGEKEDISFKNSLSSISEDGEETMKNKFNTLPVRKPLHNASSNANQFNINMVSNSVIETANKLLNMKNEVKDSTVFDEMLNKLEISMELEIEKIKDYYSKLKAPIIEELEKKCKYIKLYIFNHIYFKL